MIRKFKNIGAVLLIASIGAYAGAGIYSRTHQGNSGFIPVEERQGNAFAARMVSSPPPPESGVDFTKAADMTIHGVVHVRTFYEADNTYNNLLFPDPFRDFFWGDRNNNFNQPRIQEGTGSGVIITDDGYIVTNNHVVDRANKVEVTLNDKRTYTAKVIGKDPATDLALLKIDEQKLPFITYGNSDDLKIGEWVLAVGNPFNLTSTVTAGIVSAKARNINILNNQYRIEAFIQTDAAVNPGNSGGALVNTRGQLVGINAAIASNTGSYTGYSFAIPVNIVKKVINDLLEYGEVQRGFLGANIQDIDYKLAEAKGIKNIRGVYVSGLKEDGAAKEAGIQDGDVILKIADNSVNSVPELQEQVGQFRPGDKINVTVVRNGIEKVLAVVLKNKDGNTDVVKHDKSAIISMLGADFQPVSPEEIGKLKIQGGVKITAMNGGKLRSAGIREGFIVTHIDRKLIKNTEDLVKALQNKKGGILIEGVYENGTRGYYAFGL